MLYTQHNPGDVLNLLLDGNDIGLMCRVESRHDQYYKYCKVITDNKTNCLTTVTKDNVAVRTKQRFIKITEIEYRYLTPNEYELLQTVPIDYTAGISDSARRTMLGEGWTVDIIAHIFRYIKNTPGNP